ncbi:Transmembrane protease serine 3 [Clonorchis sinensis]|uniref:Transmembrane protease serine 3 n=2 Tax=Clonorchis sinensis TaxID=79923 RepID=A0A8T1N1D9_CLOSI|nr:Transmembrane protease serine 3 [Clonorchis sinensis]GAA50807.1 transmembrane protease serine 3 [Clonorchis sinensis]
MHFPFTMRGMVLLDMSSPLLIQVLSSENRKGPDNIPRYCGRNAFDPYWTCMFQTEPASPSSSLHLNERIVGGVQSQVGQWPWIVSLMFRESPEEVLQRVVEAGGKAIIHTNPDGSQMFHLCAGTLIHPEWIVTTAHCFFPTEAYAHLTTDPARWTARVGEFDMLDEQVPHFDVNLELIFPHPEYNGTTIANDIALIKLAEQVQLGPNVNIACLPKASNGDLLGDCCIAAGWGYTQEGSTTISSVLRHVALSVFSRKHCLEAYTKLYELYGPVIPTFQETMICAGDPDGGKDTCNVRCHLEFDSGGPLACQVDGQWYANALTSFGWECGNPSTPGVYTDVSGYVTWIQSLIPDLATRPNGFR